MNWEEELSSCFLEISLSSPASATPDASSTVCLASISPIAARSASTSSCAVRICSFSSRVGGAPDSAIAKIQSPRPMHTLTPPARRMRRDALAATRHAKTAAKTANSAATEGSTALSSSMENAEAKSSIIVTSPSSRTTVRRTVSCTTRPQHPCRGVQSWRCSTSNHTGSAAHPSPVK